MLDILLLMIHLFYLVPLSFRMNKVAPLKFLLLLLILMVFLDNILLRKRFIICLKLIRVLWGIGLLLLISWLWPSLFIYKMVLNSNFRLVFKLLLVLSFIILNLLLILSFQIFLLVYPMRIIILLMKELLMLIKLIDSFFRFKLRGLFFILFLLVVFLLLRLLLLRICLVVRIMRFTKLRIKLKNINRKFRNRSINKGKFFLRIGKIDNVLLMFLMMKFIMVLLILVLLFMMLNSRWILN